MSTTGKYDHLSPYELKRLERIRKNAEHLKKLGLGDKYHNFMRKKSPPKKRKSCPLPRVKPGEERRSGRIASKVDFVANDEKVVRQDGRNDYDFDYDDDYDDNVVDVICYRKSRRKRIEGDEWKLSEVDRKSLLGKVDDKYLGKFQEFLEYHDCISPQNVRNVMRQARKLASGEGIRYESPRYGWPEGCYFKKGVKITPMSDFIELMQEGQDCEDKYGRDHGNGWLISHPLKKLLLFQQFILNNPSFLSSKAKLKDYYGFEDDYQVSMKARNDKNLNKKTTLVPKKLDMTAGKDMIGRRVAKDFGEILHFGTLDKYCLKNQYWHVSYDDGDSEEIVGEEIESALSHYEKNKSRDNVSVQENTSNPKISRCKRSSSGRSISRSQKKAKGSVVTP